MEGVFIVKLINLVLNMYFPLHLISSRVGLNRIFVEKFHIYQESCRIPDRWIALQSSPMQLEDDVQKHNMMKFYDSQLGNVSSKYFEFEMSFLTEVWSQFLEMIPASQSSSPQE